MVTPNPRASRKARATYVARALDVLILVAIVIALYLCGVIPASALDNTLVYKGF